MYKSRHAVAAIAAAVIVCRVAAQQPVPRASYPQLFEDIWRAIDQGFYDPNFAGVDWKAMHVKYQGEAGRSENDSVFGSVVRRMLAELPVSHLGLLSPPGPRRVNLPVNTRQIDGQTVVTAGSAIAGAYRAGMRPGDRILTPVDSLRGIAGDTARVRVESCDGSVKTLSVPRGQFTLSRPRSSASWNIYQVSAQRRIGYLRVSQFDDSLASQVDVAMDDLGKTDALIIDVRDNPGGNMSLARLASYLVDKPQPVAALMMRPAIARLGRAPEQLDSATFARLPKISGVYTTAGVIRAIMSNSSAAAFYTEDVGSRRYGGRVAVLINENTGSAAEGFAGFMKVATKAPIIGQTTAGQLLGAENIALRDGWTLVMPTHAAWGPDRRRAIDTPTTPTIEVKLTRNDVCEGRDPALERAMTYVEQ